MVLLISLLLIHEDVGKHFMNLTIDNIVIAFIMGIPLILFLFLRRYLNDKKSFKFILIITILIGIVGLTLTALKVHNDGIFILLIAPIFSVLLYRVMYNFFVKKLDREPQDTFMDFSDGNYADRLFNIAFFPFGLILPIVLAIVI